MSALPPKADIRERVLDVRFGPQADSCSAAKRSLLDHLVGAGAHRRRHGEAEHLSGLEIDHQFVLGWGRHWQVGRLLALEDAIDVASRAPKLIEEIRPIRNQSAAGN